MSIQLERRHQYTLKEYPGRAAFTARARFARVEVPVVTWKCPDCGRENRTVLWPGSRRRSYDVIEARCGKCHGVSRKLIDKNGWTYADRG